MYDSASTIQSASESGFTLVFYTPDGIIQFVPVLAQLFDETPTVSLVLTHMGNPNALDGSDVTDYREVFCLAQHTDVYFQVNGMKSFCPNPYERHYGLVAETIEKFGSS